VFVYSQIHSKLLENTLEHKELQDFYLKRILMYAVTRIIPTVTNKRCLEGVSRDNVNLMLVYYKQLQGHC
jgi:hypothetical protein